MANAISHSWIIEECRRQAVIYVAEGGAAAAARNTAGCPPPLVPPGGRVADECRRLWKSAQDRLQSVAEVAAQVAAVIKSAAPQEFPAEAWTIGELVGWWLAAGERLAGQPAPWRGELEAVLARGTGQPAALWCAERWDHYNLSFADFRSQSGQHVWQRRARELGSYLAKLLAWVAKEDRRREKVPAKTKHMQSWFDAMAHESRRLADDAQSLFGPGLVWRVGEPLTAHTVNQWRCAVWSAKVPVQRGWVQVRPPVVHDGSGRGTPPVEGLVVARPPGDVIRLRRGASGSDGVDDSVAAAMRFAMFLWDDQYLPSKEWARISTTTPPAAPIESDGGFLAVARVLAAAESPAVAIGRSAVADVSIVLGLNGFRCLADDGCDAATTRLIPWIGPPCDHASRRLMFIRPKTGFHVAVGAYAREPSPATRLARAVEEHDWRLWQLTTLAASEPSREVQIQARLACREAMAAEWEPQKRQLIAGGMDAAAEPLLAGMFHHALRGRLMVEGLQHQLGVRPAFQPLMPVFAGFVATARELAAALLERLYAVDPTSLSRLQPPRLTDGTVDGVAWVSRCEERNASGMGVRFWQRDSRPWGQAIEERHDADHGVRVTLSAGDASDEDLRLLEAFCGGFPASVATAGGDADPWDILVDRFRKRIRERLVASRERLDLAPDVTWLRERCAGEDGEAFDALVRRRITGDAAATAWCRLLADDRRFGFAVHPPVDLATGVLPGVMPADERVRWEFHDSVPAGGDVAVLYGLRPEQSRRTISRGPRITSSPAAAAENVCLSASGAEALAPLAAALVDATDRWLAFPNQAPHPTTAAAPLLRVLAQHEAAPAAIRSGIHAALCAWAGSVGHDVVPADWSPDVPLEAARLTSPMGAPRFDERVPAGCVVLDAFGLAGAHGITVEASLSAGPAPAGYGALRAALEMLEASAPEGRPCCWKEAVSRVRDVPRHALADTLRFAGPNLFDCIWDSALTSGADEAADIQRAKEQIMVLLKAACGMVPFEPKTLLDYATGWVQEAGGTAPLGRRIVSLVRPGLRKIGNQLVRPALVITE